MTKTELQEKIKNGESVWYDFHSNCVEEVKLNDKCFIQDNLLIDEERIPRNIDYIYDKKIVAEHYCNHANISRSEQLPFLTWEEFLKEKYIWFVDKEQNQCCLYYVTNFILINKSGELIEKGELTEENFYKAYDECKKLFLGEL